MRIELRQTMMLECKVCGLNYDDERIKETAELRICFGSAEYAICPCCHQQVGETTFKDRNYRRRVDHFIEKRLKDHDMRRAKTRKRE